MRVKEDAQESEHFISMQHDATSAAMVRIRRAGGPVAATRRMSSGVHASYQTSNQSAEDAIGAAAGGGAKHPPAVRRGEMGEGANRGVEC